MKRMESISVSFCCFEVLEFVSTAMGSWPVKLSLERSRDRLARKDRTHFGHHLTALACVDRTDGGLHKCPTRFTIGRYSLVMYGFHARKAR